LPLYFSVLNANESIFFGLFSLYQEGICVEDCFYSTGGLKAQSTSKCGSLAENTMMVSYRQKEWPAVIKIVPTYGH